MERKKNGEISCLDWERNLFSVSLALLETVTHVSQQHSVSESRISHWVHSISISWWILNSSRLTLYMVSTWGLSAASPIWICCSHQCSSTGGNSSIDSTRLHYLILQGCDRIVKNNKLKCAYIRALVIPCVLLVLLQCWGIMDINFLYKPWFPFLFKLAIFFKGSFTFLICLQMSTKVS